MRLGARLQRRAVGAAVLAGVLVAAMPAAGVAVPSAGPAATASGTSSATEAAEWTTQKVRIGDSASTQAMSFDGGLARTHIGATAYVHVGLMRWSDSGVYYTRSTDHGATWRKAFRLNGVDQQGRGIRLASAGSNLYAAWMRDTSSGTMVYFRRNRDHGNYAGWLDRVRLTSAAGLGYPSIAAARTSVYVAYGNHTSGTVSLRISRDRGATWRRITLGSASPVDGGGNWHFINPLVTASGANIAVFWPATPGGDVIGRVSTDSGVHWSTEKNLGTSLTSAHALDARIAVAGDDAAGNAWVRVWRAGTWGSKRVVVPAGDTGGAAGTRWSPAVALRGTAQVGVAYQQSADGIATRTLWSQSNDRGATWLAAETLPQPYPWRDAGDVPSVAWRSNGRAFVLVDDRSDPQEEGFYVSLSTRP